MPQYMRNPIFGHGPSISKISLHVTTTTTIMCHDILDCLGVCTIWMGLFDSGSFVPFLDGLFVALLFFLDRPFVNGWLDRAAKAWLDGNWFDGIYIGTGS